MNVARHSYLVKLSIKLKQDEQFTNDEICTVVCKANESFDEPLDETNWK